ncbi:hypothetical protein XENOCAPTIV_024244, partial [Xenoophorus captivus]
MEPLNPAGDDSEVSGSEEEEPSEHESSGAESDDSESLLSIPVQPATPHKPLKIGQRKGEKKAVEVFDIYRVSERMARDLTWGPVQANDGRRAYIPEAGQKDYHIPAVWADRLEDKVELKVKATVGEWANILMMPSYHTLATYQPLTSKFRSAYVGVVHDVMLRRLKKAAYKYAQEIERRVDELSAEEEEEEPPLPSAPRSAGKLMKKMSEQHTTSSPEADVFREYKKIKTLVREKRSEESNEDYIKDVWPMVNNATETDEAKKLWLSHVTAHSLDKQGTAESQYR